MCRAGCTGFTTEKLLLCKWYGCYDRRRVVCSAGCASVGVLRQRTCCFVPQAEWSYDEGRVCCEGCAGVTTKDV